MLVVPEVTYSIASAICSSDQAFPLAGLLGLVIMDRQQLDAVAYVEMSSF